LNLPLARPAIVFTGIVLHHHSRGHPRHAVVAAILVTITLQGAKYEETKGEVDF